MLYLKILSIAIPYLVLSYFAWKAHKGDYWFESIASGCWTIVTIFGYMVYVMWLFGAFK